MAQETYVYPGESYWWNGSELAQEESAKRAEAISKIHTLFEAGAPLFTKEDINNISEQLKKCGRRGQKVSVRGFDGTVIDVEIESELTLPGFEPHLEFIIGSPFIHYLSIQNLTSSINKLNFVSRLAYCNLRIYHRMHLRDKFTKESVAFLPSRSYEEVEEFFSTQRQAWESSKSCKKLQSLLESINLPAKINKIIGVALGSISLGHQDEGPIRSSYQHALILTLRDHIKKRLMRNDLRCYAQDPAYTKIDSSILEQSGVYVLADPEAFLEVDDSTIVISCAADIPVKQIISDLAQPAMMIWDKILNEGPEVTGSDPESPRVRDMIRSFYDELEFHDEKHFGALAIYVRQMTPQKK